MLNLRLMVRNVRVVLMIASLGIPGWATAAEIQWAQTEVEGGLTVAVPRINMDALLDEIVALKTGLKHDEKLLSRDEEKKRTKGGDTVLAILLPGGLLYAAYKKNAHAKAVQDHELVSSQLKEITTELVALTTINGPVMVAKR